MLYSLRMKILSIDLASKRYDHFGWALLELGASTPQFPTADQLGLSDPPDAITFASAIQQFCTAEDVHVLMLDGPQAWRYPGSPIDHMRLCERALNTPGKTGVPGVVKPRTYHAFIHFSIEVFNALRHMGWSLLEESFFQDPVERLVIECFPSCCWRTLGLKKLPAKGRLKTSELEPFRRSLAEVSGYALPQGLTHDELQAAVALPVGEALARRERESLVLAGVDPIIEGDIVYEGWIPLPKIV